MSNSALAKHSCLQSWLSEQRNSCGLSLGEVSLSDCRSWNFTAGRFSHLTGGFFSIVGVHARSNVPGLHNCVQPVIDQPEIGILGFVVRKVAARHEWLLQAKAEPGNVGAVQIAPTVQATRSNYTCLHGGAPTPYLNHFNGVDAASVTMASTLQSEHGSRFLGKYNQNSTVFVPDSGPAPVSPNWLWAPSSELKSALLLDFAVNTDARSVLFSSDWKLLADGEPFCRWADSGGWGETLLKSFNADDEEADGMFMAWLAERRNMVQLEVNIIPLQAMDGWKLTQDGIVSNADGLLRVRAFHVKAKSREVEEWEQPLMLSPHAESIIQICQFRDGIMRFLFRASAEVGFSEFVQLGPTWQSDDMTRGNGRADQIAALCNRAVERYATLQSDEGGRFYNSVCRYRIMELPDDVILDVENDGYRWTSLAQIYRLADIPGVFTNEARSALSMLLSDL